MVRNKYFFIILIFIGFSSSYGQQTLEIREVVTDLDTPWEILWGPDNWIWMTEREGRVSRVNPETGEQIILLQEPEINVTETGEAGLLGMTLHPDFPDTPYVYIVYNYYTTSLYEKLERWTYENDSLINPFTLLDAIPAAGNHNGSRLFIDKDHTLYMSTGDAGDKPSAQDNSSVSGKILRMNLDGSVPDDNPIPGSLIWSKGHRNPQGLIKASNGIIYSSEHGPQNDDEFQIILKGRNYGWPEAEGFCDEILEEDFCLDSNVVEPLKAWTPTLAVCGIDFYDHNAIPEWQNSVLMATLKEDKLVQLKLNEAGDSVIETNIYFEDQFGRLRDVCVSPDGRVFIATSNRDGRGNDGFPQPDDDKIIEIKGPCMADSIQQPVITRSGDTLIASKSTDYQWYVDSTLIDTASSQKYVAPKKGVYYVMTIDSNGCKAFSDTLAVLLTDVPLISNEPYVKVYPNPAENLIKVQYLLEEAESGGIEFHLFDVFGKQIMEKKLPYSGEPKESILDIQQLRKGVYFLRVKYGNKAFTKKIIKPN